MTLFKLIVQLYRIIRILVEDLPIFHQKCTKVLQSSRKDLGFTQEHKIYHQCSINKSTKQISKQFKKRIFNQENNKPKIEKDQIKVPNHERNPTKKNQNLSTTMRTPTKSQTRSTQSKVSQYSLHVIMRQIASTYRAVGKVD